MESTGGYIQPDTVSMHHYIVQRGHALSACDFQDKKEKENVKYKNLMAIPKLPMMTF